MLRLLASAFNRFNSRVRTIIPPIILVCQLMLPKENVEILLFSFRNTIYHLENAEMTTELRDDLINFSFDNLHNVFKNFQIHNPNIHLTLFDFLPEFLECLKKLVCHHFHFYILCIFMHFT